MKVLIHALGADMGGSVRHLTNFLPELARRADGPEYVVLVRQSLALLSPGGNIRIERVPDAVSRGWAKRIVGDVLALPGRLKRESFAAVVSLTNFGPVWSPVPHIMFQRNALYYCSHYLARISGRLHAETLLRRRLAAASMRRASRIVTPSTAMAKMIHACYPDINEARLQTLYHGFENNGLEEPLDAKVQGALCSGEGFKLLFPTHAGIHKGFDVLLRILSRLQAEGCNFRLYTTISREEWPQGSDVFERSALELGIVFLGRVAEAQMPALYRGCDLMVYPSLCESFGFSMIEAMGHGLPIVAADTGVNREICQDGAIYYPPLDAAVGANAIAEALDQTRMATLAQAGSARLDSFDWSWRRYANEFSRLVQEVL
jgi:glycosyltransferase involved in cell wall biosynthesis